MDFPFRSLHRGFIGFACDGFSMRFWERLRACKWLRSIVKSVEWLFCDVVRGARSGEEGEVIGRGSLHR